MEMGSARARVARRSNESDDLAPLQCIAFLKAWPVAVEMAVHQHVPIARIRRVYRKAAGDAVVELEQHSRQR